MDTPAFQVGDLVMIADDFVRPDHRGITYRVTRKLKVNLELEPVAGGRRVRANAQVLVPASPDTDPKANTTMDITIGARVLVRLHATDRAYATVTAIDHDHRRDYYRLSVAGINEYRCTSEQVVRILTEEEFRDHNGHGDPDRRHIQRHPVAGRPAPYVELTRYLIALAAEHGYAVDADVLDPTVGFHPREVIWWAAAGASHATIGYMQHLLAGPIGFLAEQDPDSGLLDRLRDHDAHLAQVRAAAARRYAACCHTLLPTGLIWPAQPAGGTAEPAHPGNPPDTTNPDTR